MPIRRYTIDPPFVRLPGDAFVLNGAKYEQWRSGVLVDVRDLTTQESQRLTEPEHFGPTEVTLLYLEEHMPGVSATLTKVSIEEGTGIYRYRFSDGSENEFPNRAAVVAAVQDLDTNIENAKKFLILSSIRRDDNGANAGIMEGRSCTLDGAAQMPLSLSLAVELG